MHYTQVQTVFTLLTVINRAEHSQSILIIAHKYMCMCNHAIVIAIISYQYTNTSIIVNDCRRHFGKKKFFDSLGNLLEKIFL